MNAFRWGTLLTATVIGLLAASPAIAQDPEPVRPAYNPILRQNEDWSALRNQPRTDPFDPIKYIPLTDDGGIWLSIGGQARTRVEAWNNFNFNRDNDDVFLLTRLRLHGDLHLGENIRLFAEGKSALSTDRDLPGGRRTLDVDTLDLQQAFADLQLPIPHTEYDLSLRLRGGRQMLLFGKQRLVSPLDWSNTMRTWDGLSATLQADRWNVTGFWTHFAPVRKYDFNSADDNIQFWGLYATGPVIDAVLNADAYVLVFDRADAVYPGAAGDEERYTLGARLFGAFNETRIDYDIEAAWQFGEVGNSDIAAWMFASELGYRLAQTPTAPRLHMGFDYASGDDADNARLGTFNQLFPLGHAYLGHIDVIGRQNIIALNGGATIKPTEKATLILTGHWFWRASSDDALYNAGGGVVRPAAATSREVGQEIDLRILYQIDRHWSVLTGYSHFFAGSFIKETGPARDIDFGYLQVQFTF